MADRIELEEPTERSPLLTQSDEPENTTAGQHNPKSWQPWEKIMLLVLAVVLLTSLGDQWQESPHTRIMEAVICYQYFEDVDPSKLLLGRNEVGPGAIGGVAEMYCKADDVQSKLAMIRGWQATFDGLPCLLLALPVGWAGDRYGRKPVLVAGLLAFVLSAAWKELVLWYWQVFNIEAIWFSTIFASLGGGSAMTVTFLFVVLSDITPEEKRADAFLRAGAFNILAALVMPPLAAWLMNYNPWIPALGGTVLIIISALLTMTCPETLNFKNSSTSTSTEEDSSSTATERTPDSPATNQTLMNKARHGFAELKQASALSTDWRVPALISTWIFHLFVGTIGQLLMQYLSKRYGLTFSNATLLMTIKNGVTVLLLFVLLPYLSTLIMRKFRLSAQRKDLYLVRVSLGLVAVGWMLVGLSPNIPTVAISLSIASLGMGFALLLRSFLTSLVEAHHIARVYSIISIVDTLGFMFGSPLLAGLFKRGLALGGGWVGLPFYFTGLAGFVFMLLLSCIQLRKGEDEHASAQEDE